MKNNNNNIDLIKKYVPQLVISIKKIIHMQLLAKIFILLTALIHIFFFKLESIDFMKPEVLKKFNLNIESGSYVQPWAFNQGFYNLFFAGGLIFSLHLMKNPLCKAQGRVLAQFILISALLAGVVLFLSTGKTTAACTQAIPPLVALIFLYFSKKESRL